MGKEIKCATPKASLEGSVHCPFLPTPTTIKVAKVVPLDSPEQSKAWST